MACTLGSAPTRFNATDDHARVERVKVTSLDSMFLQVDVDMCMDMSIDMCMNVWIGICIDMCMDV